MFNPIFKQNPKASGLPDPWVDPTTSTPGVPVPQVPGLPTAVAPSDAAPDPWQNPTPDATPAPSTPPDDPYANPWYDPTPGAATPPAPPSGSQPGVGGTGPAPSAPKTGAEPAFGPPHIPTRAEVEATYQKWLGRSASDKDWQSWAGNPNFETGIQNSPEAKNRPGSPGNPSGTNPAPGGSGSTPSASKPTRPGWTGGPSDPATYSGGNGKLPGYTGPTGAVDPAQWKQFTADLGLGQDKGDHKAVYTLMDRLKAAGYSVSEGPISETGQLDSLYINGQLVRVFDSSGTWNYQPDAPGSPAWDMPGEDSKGGGGAGGSDSSKWWLDPGAAQWNNPSMGLPSASPTPSGSDHVPYVDVSNPDRSRGAAGMSAGTLPTPLALPESSASKRQQEELVSMLLKRALNGNA